MFKNKTRKRMTLVLAVVTCAALLVGSFAFFTDRATFSATAAAGNIDLVFTDMSTFGEHKVDGQTNGYTDGKVWTDGKLVADGQIMNPGDNFDLGYKIANTGSKSIDVKTQIVLTSSVALIDAAEEYQIVVAGQTITPVKSDDDKTLTYELAEVVLNGTAEADGTAAELEYDVYLAFSRNAKNAFMNSTVSLKLDIQAKQHRNTTSADWAPWATYTADYEVIA